MTRTAAQPSSDNVQSIPFKAETRQLLDILIHSLYTERDIFLRELISNASDALTRMDFELLTNRTVLDPDAELAIRILPDEKEHTLTITDSGVGMTAEELAENLGTIAHSGARAFIDAAREHGAQNLSQIIGQFGVGFYSAFMVADWIKVISRSYRPEAGGATWYSTGSDTFSIGTEEKADRGTSVIVKLKEDASEFLQESHLRDIIRLHSDFIPFPIYIGEQGEQINRQVALWRQAPRQVEEEEYHEYYKQLTLDLQPPLAHAHMVVDAPVQMYALLFIPNSPERGLFSARKEDGLKLFSRKVLIQEYCKDLTPEYLRFVHGVVDSEDLPLNISRQTIQSSRAMGQLKKLVTSKILDTLEQLAKEDQSKYERFWQAFKPFLKQGVAMEQENPQALYPLLRFHTTIQPDQWSSLEDYVARMRPDQKSIYYLLGDDERSVHYSPHLDLIRRHGYEVLLLTDPLDPLVLVKLDEYAGHTLVNLASSDLELPEIDQGTIEPEGDQAAEADFTFLIERFKTSLGEQVADVRVTDRLADAPARLVDPQGAPNQEMQRLYRLLDKEFTAPKKVLELNTHHPIIARLNDLAPDDPRISLVIEQIYENALLIEGLHPNPASMINRIQQIITAALD